MLKCDFHIHSREDPHDVLEHTAVELIDHAAQLEYQVLALTLHGRLYCPQELRDHAASKGILLIPGIEVYLNHCEVLLLGVNPQDLDNLKTFDDLRALKKARGDEILVIAPHPFYGLRQCVGARLEQFADVFDAIEFCHFYTLWWNPNRRAEMLARRLDKPIIACSDTHRLRWMKDHYNLVDAQPTQDDVFAAIRAGRFQNITRPLDTGEAIRRALWYFILHITLKIFRAKGWIRKPCQTDPSAKLHRST